MTTAQPPAPDGADRPGSAYVDATETEYRPALLPGTVAELVDRGFRPLGRVAQLSHATASDLQFDRSERARLAVWRARPAFTLLAAPDETAYVSVDVYGEAPFVRVRTELTDGSMVETIGLAPEGMLRTRRSADPYAQFGFPAAEGYSQRVVREEEPARVIEEHIRHVAAVTAARGQAPRRHDDLADAVRMWNRAAAHTIEAARRWTRWSRAMGAAALALSLLVGYALAVGLFVRFEIRTIAPAVLIAFGVGLPVSVLFIFGTASLQRRLFRLSWWRPAYSSD